jgi:hypothetical protein
MVDTSGSTGYLVQVRQYFPSSDILMWLAEFAKATELYLPLSDHVSELHILDNIYIFQCIIKLYQTPVNFLMERRGYFTSRREML